jgi:hypothetical protein
MFVVGVSGVARSGKNLFCDMIAYELEQRGITSRQFALADALKADCEEFLKENCSLDVWTSDTKNKSLFRDFLVWYGDLKRKQTNGQYWIQKMNEAIAKSTKDVALISDVRYDAYERDELSWVQEEHDGMVIHLKRYLEQPSVYEHAPRRYVEAPNEHERVNDPKLHEGADIRVEWPTVQFPWESKRTHEITIKIATQIEERVRVYEYK